MCIRDSLRSELPLEVDQIATEQPVDPLNPVRQVGVNCRGEKVSLPRDGELRLELEQLALGGAVELALFRCRVTPISVRDGARGGQGAQHDLVGDDLCLAARALAAASAIADGYG